MRAKIVFEADTTEADKKLLLDAIAKVGADCAAIIPAAEFSFFELCIGVALWGMFDVTRLRLFKTGVLLTKEQFMTMGFKAMLPPITMLKLGAVGWPFMIMTEQPRVPANGGPDRLNLKKMGLG